MLGAMPTALRGHGETSPSGRVAFPQCPVPHAHAKPWAWHPVSPLTLLGTLCYDRSSTVPHRLPQRPSAAAVAPRRRPRMENQQMFNRRSMLKLTGAFGAAAAVSWDAALQAADTPKANGNIKQSI